MYNYYIDKKINDDKENQEIKKQNKKIEKVKRKSNYLI